MSTIAIQLQTTAGGPPSVHRFSKAIEIDLKCRNKASGVEKEIVLEVTENGKPALRLTSTVSERLTQQLKKDLNAKARRDKWDITGDNFLFRGPNVRVCAEFGFIKIRESEAQNIDEAKTQSIQQVIVYITVAPAPQGQSRVAQAGKRYAHLVCADEDSRQRDAFREVARAALQGAPPGAIDDVGGDLWAQHQETAVDFEFWSEDLGTYTPEELDDIFKQVSATQTEHERAVEADDKIKNAVDAFMKAVDDVRMDVGTGVVKDWYNLIKREQDEDLGLDDLADQGGDEDAVMSDS